MNNLSKYKYIFTAVTFLLVSPCFGDEIYIFQAGDTLYSLARRFDVSVEEIQLYSNISDPTDIMIGTHIKIPTSTGTTSSYTIYNIHAGDTLYSIARNNGIPLDSILLLNSLTETSILRIGMQIKIPQEKNITEQNTVNQHYTQNTVNSEGTPYWPHPGRIKELEGELSKAIVIFGSEGDKVVSVSSGTVTWAGPFRGYGKMIFIKCSNGYVFGYGGHEDIFVNVGDNITIGLELGTLGINSHDGVAKVFFFVAKNGIPLRPSEVPRS